MAVGTWGRREARKAIDELDWRDVSSIRLRFDREADRQCGRALIERVMPAPATYDVRGQVKGERKARPTPFASNALWSTLSVPCSGVLSRL